MDFDLNPLPLSSPLSLARPFWKKVPGKWVLTGEHAVLHGGLAVALPHPELSLSLLFEPDQSASLVIEPREIRPLIDELLGFISKEFPAFVRPKGTLRIQSTIPIAAGLGSSAALCVALAYWLSESFGFFKGPFVEDRTENHSQADRFATRLEDLFHGKSSGMDVAVIAAGVPITFGMKQGVEKLGIRKLPRFTFHDSGLRSRTRECIQKVEQFRLEKPEQGKKLDREMGLASGKAIKGLRFYDAGLLEQGLVLIAEAMNQAKSCFYDWGLMPLEIQNKEKELLKAGARAVKLTGAGNGGILVALW